MTQDLNTPAGLPRDALPTLAALVAPHLSELAAQRGQWVAAGNGETPDDAAVVLAASPDVLLDALYAAGVLILPGQAALRLPAGPARFHDQPAMLAEVAGRVEPILRDVARNTKTVWGDEAWAEAADATDLVASAPPQTLLMALDQAGLLVFDHADDRASLRASWAAISTALIRLSAHEDIPDDIAQQIPTSHLPYLLGQAALRRQHEAACRRLTAVRTLAEVAPTATAGRHDPGYLRATLTVIGRLAAGDLPADLPQPRIAAPPERDREPWQQIRYIAAANTFDRLALADPVVVAEHADAEARILAYQAALYGWATAILLAYLAEHHGPDTAQRAAEAVQAYSETGVPLYCEDLTDDSPTAADLAGQLAAAGAARGRAAAEKLPTVGAWPDGPAEPPAERADEAILARSLQPGPALAQPGDPTCDYPHPDGGPACQRRPTHDTHLRVVDGGTDVWNAAGAEGRLREHLDRLADGLREREVHASVIGDDPVSAALAVYDQTVEDLERERARWQLAARTARPGGDDRWVGRRLVRGGINAAVGAIVETVHPYPRGGDCLTVSRMERKLAEWFDDTLRLALRREYRNTLADVVGGGDPATMLAEAEKRYQQVLAGFGENDRKAPGV